MHTRAMPLEQQLLSDNFFRRCFERAGVLDQEQRFARHQSAPLLRPWAAAADAGNKGREIDMIIVSIWCATKKKPLSESLAAADLMGDQTGKHLAVTLERAMDKAGLLNTTCYLPLATRYLLISTYITGLHPEGCTQALTDGASACSGKIGESQLFIEKLQARARANRRAHVHYAIKETCAIHGKVKYKV